MSDEVIFKPGREFSAIHVGLDLNLTAMDRALEAMNVWDALVEKYPEAAYEGPSAPEDAPAANGRPAASRGSGTGVWCREHRAEMSQSPRKMQGGEFDVFMHPFPEGETGPQGGKFHTLYFRETVDVVGESNEGKPLPSSVKQPPVEAQTARPDGDPGPNEPQF